MRRSPDPDQMLFRWVWGDPADDRPDGPADDLPDDRPPAAPPPLRSRVRRRAAPKTVVLWGNVFTLGKVSERPVARPEGRCRGTLGHPVPVSYRPE